MFLYLHPSIKVDPQPPGRAFVAQLRKSVSNIEFGSKGFDQAFAKAYFRFKKEPLDKRWKPSPWPSFGPNPIHIVSVGLIYKPQKAGIADEVCETVNIAFWPSGAGTCVQLLDEYSIGLFGKHHFEDYRKDHSEAYRNADRLVICGLARDIGNRVYPAVRIYRLTKRFWDPVAEEMDDGHGPGTARFVRYRGHVSGNLIFASSSDSSSHAFLRVRYERRWYVSGERIEFGAGRLAQGPSETLVRLIHLVEQGRRDEFDLLVPSKCRSELWNLAKKGAWWHDDVEGTGTKTSWTFRAEPKYREGTSHMVTLVKKAGKWRVSNISLRKWEG